MTPEEAFRARVDQALVDLERQTPALTALRKVPMDLIADAVAREVRVIGGAVTEASIRQALLAIFGRNIHPLTMP